MTPYARSHSSIKIVWTDRLTGERKQTHWLRDYQLDTMKLHIGIYGGKSLYLVRCFEYGRKRRRAPA